MTFTPETITHLKNIGEGYEFTKAFELDMSKAAILLNNTNGSPWSSMLLNREHALRLRQFMTPEQDLTSKDETAHPFLQDKERKYRALNQIFRIAQKNNSRPVQGTPFSMLMFLPFGGNLRIGELCRVWASFMLESKYWRENFVFLTLSVYNNTGYRPDPKIKNNIKEAVKMAVEKGRICHREDFDGDLKNTIIEIEKEALRQGKGLVLLSGDVAKMGISLKCVDVVFLMSNNKEADDIIQKMYRALTDDPPNKKDGFIVDLDLKRIVRAMFDYDLEKDKMRLKNPVLPSIKERLEKVWDLCYWGQDSYIEDHPELNFNDIMDAIKKRVLTDLEKKILYDFDEKFKKLREIQMNIIREDSDLYNKIISTLQYTSHKKGVKSKSVTMGESGQSIPGASSDSTVQTSGPTRNILPTAPKLSHLEIEIKLMSIIQTFINSLVIKSSEPWSTTRLNLSALLDKYYIDKQLINGSPDCNCNKENNCKTPHDNLYEIVFCELSNYAMISVGNNKYKYDASTHTNIMERMEEIFKNQSIFIEWNIYIQNLLNEIKESKKVQLTDKHTGGRRRTRRKYRGIVRNGF